jgi:glycosyltransferase involved in cell wall biosynthesis
MVGRVHVALNTLDVDAISASVSCLSEKEVVNMRGSFGFKSDDVVLAFVGRISEEKNPHYITEVVRCLRREGLAVRALFIGDGPDFANLQSSLKNETDDIQESIKFTGRLSVSQVSPLLKMADISVMPGMTGLAIVHSFAVGLPYITVASSLHSPEIEYLMHGVNGLITDNSPQSFVDGVRGLVINSKLRNQMGESGRFYVLNNVNINNQMAGFVNAINFIKNKNS